MANQVVLSANAQVTEDLVLSSGAGTKRIAHDAITAFSATYTAGGTPDHDTVYAAVGLDGNAGADSLDLTALTDTKGDALDLTGKKINAVFIKAAAANNAGGITFKVGTTTGYAIFGASDSSVKIFPGGAFLWAGNDGNADVSASLKLLDVTGTAGDLYDIVISAGD